MAFSMLLSLLMAVALLQAADGARRRATSHLTVPLNSDGSSLAANNLVNTPFELETPASPLYEQLTFQTQPTLNDLGGLQATVGNLKNWINDGGAKPSFSGTMQALNRVFPSELFGDGIPGIIAKFLKLPIEISNREQQSHQGLQPYLRDSTLLTATNFGGNRAGVSNKLDVLLPNLERGTMVMLTSMNIFGVGFRNCLVVPQGTTVQNLKNRMRLQGVVAADWLLDKTFAKVKKNPEGSKIDLNKVNWGARASGREPQHGHLKLEQIPDPEDTADWPELETGVLSHADELIYHV